jgi:hypothetical protein
MTVTTITVRKNVRDELARVAADDLGGVSLDSALELLLEEHHKARILAAFERLRADPVAWAEYTAEQEEWDATAADGLGGDPWEGQQRREGEE